MKTDVSLFGTRRTASEQLIDGVGGVFWDILGIYDAGEGIKRGGVGEML